MTFRELCMDHLVSCCMWKEQAIQVCQAYLEGDLGSNMVSHFDKEATGYPPNLQMIVVRGVTLQAVEWLRENAIQAFYLPAIMVSTGKPEWDTVEKCIAVIEQLATDADIQPIQSVI